MMSKAKQFQDLEQLGNNTKLQKPEKHAATKFAGALYGKANCISLNSLRCEKASAKSLPANKLPTTENSFDLHLQRYVHQLVIWQETVTALQEILDPLNFGYEKSEYGRSVSWN